MTRSPKRVTKKFCTLSCRPSWGCFSSLLPSMATPLTLGVAMLLWSQNPALPAEDVKKWLENQATPVPELAGYCATGAIVSAVQKASPVTPTQTPTPIPTNTPRPTSSPDPLENLLSGGGCSAGIAELSFLFLLPLLLLFKK